MGRAKNYHMMVDLGRHHSPSVILYDTEKGVVSTTPSRDNIYQAPLSFLFRVHSWRKEPGNEDRWSHKGLEK